MKRKVKDNLPIRNSLQQSRPRLSYASLYSGSVASWCFKLLGVFLSFLLSVHPHQSSGQETEQLLCCVLSPISSSYSASFWPSGFCFPSFPFYHWQFPIFFSLSFFVIYWPGSLPLLKGFLKPSSQIRRRAVATGSYFRCLTCSLKGIMRSLRAWPFPSMSRKGLWVCSFPIISLPAPTLRGVGWRSCYWPV